MFFRSGSPEMAPGPPSSMISNVRPRLAKLPSLAMHGLRSLRDRPRLAALALDSAVARAIRVTGRDEFGPHERSVFAEIENARRELYARRDTFECLIEDPLDPTTVPPAERQVVGERAQVSSVKPHWGRFLYTLAREVRPALCIELGACLGVSGLFIQAGLREAGVGRLVTFEGSRAMAEIAAENYRKLGFNDFSVVTGDFDRQLGPALDSLPGIDIAFVDGNSAAGTDRSIRCNDPASRGRHRSDRARRHPVVHRDGYGVAVSPGDDSSALQVFDLFRMGVIKLGRTEDRLRPVSAWMGASS